MFSIVMATYNRANCLPRAIRSVLNQTYKGLELIVVDDGSTDNTERVVKNFKDDRIVYFRQPNMGVLSARNRGFDLAKGEYIALLDDDDELIPKALETVMEYFEMLAPPDIGMLWFDGINRITVCGNDSGGELSCRDKDIGRSGWGLDRAGFIHYEDLLYGRIKGNHWQVVKKDSLGSNRFDERLYCGEILLWLKLLKTNSVYYVPEELRINHLDSSNHVSGKRTMLDNLPGLILTNKEWLSMYDQRNRYYYKRLAILRLYQVLKATEFVWKR